MATRRERVVLELEDNFTSGMARAAAATALLDRAIDGLDGKTVDVDTNVRTVTSDVDTLGNAFRRAGPDIDSFSGRLGLLTKGALLLGPALAPIGAVGVAGVAGLANQLGFTAVAAGTAVLAFQGVGDALEAVNKAALEPTTESLQAAQDALDGLSPAASALVTQLQSMKPLLDGLRDTAAEGMFPGLISGLQDLEQVAPKVERVISSASSALGDLFAAAGDDLADGRWDDFFRMLARDAGPTLADMGSAIGDVAHGFSELWEAFAPLNRDFGSWLADAAHGFDKWATGLKKTEGFEEFIGYIRENGPVVAEAAMAIGDALVQIVEAAAPLGGPVLHAVTSLAEAIATIADSPLGTPLIAAAGAMSALSLATNIATASVGRLNAGLASIGRTGFTGATANQLGLALAGFTTGLVNAIDQMNEFSEGEQSMSDSLMNLVPGFREIGILQNQFGADIDGMLTSLRHGGDEVGKFAGSWDPDPILETALATDVFAKSAAGVVSPLERAKASLRDAQGAARDTAASFFDLSTSMEPKKFDLGKWIDQLEQQADALRNFRLNAEKAAEKGLAEGLIKQLQKLGPEGKIQLAALANASQREINRANEAWRSGRAEQRKYVDSINDTKGALAALGTSGKSALNSLGAATGAPKAALQALGTEAGATKKDLQALGGVKVNPKINVTSNAAAAAAATTAALNNIADETVIINIERAGAALNPMMADGGTVPGQRYPYADKTLILAAPGEEIITNRNGEADRFRRDRALGRIPAYAEGGMVTASDLHFGTTPRNPQLGEQPFYDLGSIFNPKFLRQSIRDLNKDLRALGREVNQSERAMNKQEKVLDKATRAYEKQADVVDEIRGQFDDLAGAISGGLTTALGAGLDATSNSPWAQAPDLFSTLMGTLSGDTARGRAFDRARDTIDDFIQGDALEQFMRELSPEQFIQAAGLSGDQLEQLEAAFNLRASVVGAAGTGGGNAVYGAELRTQTAAMTGLHNVMVGERDEWRAFRDEWREDKQRQRKYERDLEILERQLRQTERELERLEKLKDAGRR